MGCKSDVFRAICLALAVDTPFLASIDPHTGRRDEAAWVHDVRRILVAMRTLLVMHVEPSEEAAWLVTRVIAHFPDCGLGIVDVVHAWEIMGMSGCRNPDTSTVSMLNRQTLRMIPRIQLLSQVLCGSCSCQGSQPPRPHFVGYSGLQRHHGWNRLCHR